MTMVERVARALADEEGYAYDPLPYDARARAAIEAMREPTEAMLDVQVVDGTHMDGSTHYVQDLQLNEIWRALIAAALAEATDAPNHP